jgi:tRNA-dihydrouridine synthase B
MVAKTGCDAVMIGRAAPANPWIFRQIAQYTATGSYERPTVEDRYRMIRAYFQMLLDEAELGADDRNAAIRETGAPGDRSSSTGRETAGKMKQFASWFTHGVPGGAKLRAAVYQARTGTDVLARVDAFFEGQRNAAPEAEQDFGLDGVPAYPESALVCD